MDLNGPFKDLITASMVFNKSSTFTLTVNMFGTVTKTDGNYVITEPGKLTFFTDGNLSSGTYSFEGDTLILVEKIGGKETTLYLERLFNVPTIIFGSYEQDNNLANGKEPIEWVVLEQREDGSMVLMSKYALDAKPYNPQNTDVTWETCTLRKWLNEEFYNAAFSDPEQAKIMPVTLENEANPLYGTTSGNATQDRVWLLSINEVTNEYSKGKAYSCFTNDTSRICYLTAYAIAQGAYSFSDICWWPLRSTGENFGHVACVDSVGFVRVSGMDFNNVGFGVRPVVVIQPSVEKSEYTSGDYTYAVLGDGSAEITSYDGSAKVLEIPSELGGLAITSIGDDAFSNCDRLTAVTIPDSVTSIGDDAFFGCDSLTSITIPDSVTSVGSNPFNYCRYLTEINVSPDHPYLAMIDGVLFSKPDRRLIYYPTASEATEFSIPQGTQSIGDDAFYNCDSLTSITIPDSVTSIGDGAFSGCDSLTSITIPDSVTSVGSNPFNFCRYLTEINVSPDHPYLAMIDGVLFSKPDRRLIYYPTASEATEFSIPQGTQSIGDGAFRDCDSLTAVTIPDSVTSVGDYAFADCVRLTAVTIPDSVTSIGDYAFFYCASLTSITIPDSVTNIGDYAFRDCGRLTSITIPDSVTSIGDYAFYKCYNLTAVTIPDSVTSIGDGAFSACNSLTAVTIPDSVTWIGDYAFYECDTLNAVTIHGNITSIGVSAFEGCPSLTAVTITEGVTSIGDYAFRNCDSLTSITIPDSVMSIGRRAFYSCDILTAVTIPDSVTSIGDYAFYRCAQSLIITVDRDSFAEQYCKDYEVYYTFSDGSD